MILWINGAFGVGKTTTAFELQRRIPNSFVYDPENAGYFIRKNSPVSFSKGDFQDIPLWRKINFEMLMLLSTQYKGVIIVPMTLVSKLYYDEIVTNLINNGIEVRHFILYASRETIINRLNKRCKGRSEAFAMQSIERCFHFFDTCIKEIKITTDNKNIDDVISEIAGICDLILM
ncbi:MAG: AAA family ATPase [Defluviitaleaceae bacterium]|nr:AAA family ATPase [Defluviitaleaceae bacterium]